MASAAVGLVVEGRVRQAWGGKPARPLRAEDQDRLSPFERLHLPVLQLPIVTANGAKVPLVVEMTHPMEPDHSITSVGIVNDRDPVPSKGEFHFTPANGQVYLAFQVRLDHGTSDVMVTADCNLHGRWSSTRPINIPEGAGGCAGSAPPPGRPRGDEIHPPVIRIPQLVKHGRIRPDELIDVQLKIRHPNRTGLVYRDGKFVQESEPFYLKDLEAYVGDERVSRFAMTSAVSDDPFITFKLRARSEGPLRIVLANNRGQQFEATHQIRFS